MNSAYRSGLDLAGLPASAARSARQSVFAGLAVAHKLGSASLLSSVRSAFVHGMDVMLAGLCGVGRRRVLLALVFLPRGEPARREASSQRVESSHELIA